MGRDDTDLALDLDRFVVAPDIVRSTVPAPSPLSWEATVALPSFRALVASKRRVIVPLMLVYMTYFFGFTLLAGYARGWMGTPVAGALNIGYVLLLAIYALCWIIAVVYVLFASFRFDRQAERCLEQAIKGETVEHGAP